jgi:pimeloyl-ACP methyl ester carboxylesterase
MLAHYTAMTRVPGGRYVTAAFVGGSLSCDIASDLPFLTVPVLIIWGAKAAIGPGLAKAHEYAAIGNSVELHIYPDCGALPHEEDAPGVAADIERFLRTDGRREPTLAEA